MPEERIEKVRYVLEDPNGEKVCLKDIIDLCVSMTMVCSKLEWEHNRSAIVDLKKQSKELRDLTVRFNERCKSEIFNDIVHWQSNNDPKSQGLGGSLKHK